MKVTFKDIKDSICKMKYQKTINFISKNQLLNNEGKVIYLGKARNQKDKYLI